MNKAVSFGVAGSSLVEKWRPASRNKPANPGNLLLFIFFFSFSFLSFLYGILMGGGCKTGRSGIKGTGSIHVFAGGANLLPGITNHGE